MNFQSLIARQRAHKILALTFALVFFWGSVALAAGTPVFACGFNAGCLHCKMPGRVLDSPPACCRTSSGLSAVACSMTCCSDDVGMSARFPFVVPDNGVEGTAFSNLAACTSPGHARIAPMPAPGSQDYRLSAAAATVVYLQNLSLRL